MVSYVHCADLHIGKSKTFPDYLGRQGLMLDAIFSIAKSHSDGLVLIAGDIYDCPILTPREKNLFLEKLAKADQDGLTTVIINGNHDIIDQKDGEGYTHLRTVKDLVESHRLQNTFCIESDPQGFLLPKFGLGIVALPALYRKSREVNKITGTYTRALRKAHGDQLPILAVVHEAVVGATNDSGHPFEGGVKLDSTIPVTAWCLGDIHKRQSIPGVPDAWYPGCPIQHDFGDVAERGVLVATTTNPCEPEFHSLWSTVPPLRTLELEPGQDARSIVWSQDSIWRVIGTREQLAGVHLPPNVVRTNYVKHSGPTSPAHNSGLGPKSDQDILAGLQGILAERGMDEEGRKWCLGVMEGLK